LVEKQKETRISVLYYYEFSYTSACIRASRIMKLVAQVSSSIRSSCAPASTASTMAAPCDVLPLASSLEKLVVELPNGKLFKKGEMSTLETRRPSSARTFI